MVPVVEHLPRKCEAISTKKVKEKSSTAPKEKCNNHRTQPPSNTFSLFRYLTNIASCRPSPVLPLLPDSRLNEEVLTSDFPGTFLHS
jgi:hypothetical protein